MKARTLLVLAPLLLAAPRAARAATPLEDARTLTSQATVEYNVGRFQEALELYTKAYERLPKPALLFNIGQCHRLLGHYDQALFFYHGFLRERPDAPNRSLVEQHIDESQKALDAQRAAQQAAEKKAAASAAPPPPPVQPPPSPSPEPIAPASQAGLSADTTQPTPPSPALRIAGVATAGAGVLLIGTGIALGVHASSLSSELSQVSAQHGTWSSEYQSDYDSGKSAATAATVLYIAGGTALAAGAVLTYLGWPKSHAPVTASVAPTQGGAAFGLAGAF